MKKMRISSKTVNYVIGALMLFFVAAIFFFLSTDGNSSSSSYEIKRLPPIDPIVSDSLPNYEYKRLKGDIEFSREMKNGVFTSSASDAWFTGFTMRERCDTCSRANVFPEGEGRMLDYLIRLKWWELDTGTRIQPNVYYVNNGQSFLRKTVCEFKNIGKLSHSSNYECHQTDIPVSFRYDKMEKGIMIPVSKTTLAVFKPFFMIVIWGGTFFCLYFILTALLKVLVDIRNGDPFSERNVKRLRWLTVFCFSAPTILFLLNLLMWVIFYRHFTEDVKLSSEAWLIFWKPFVLGLIFAALYSAFKRGKQLKEEQDLTI